MTDYIEQLVRSYTVLRREDTSHQVTRPHRQSATAPEAAARESAAIKAIGAPYEGWCFVFDTETTTDTAQALRFGFYAVYGLDRDERMRLYRAGTLTREALDTPHTTGIFYNPATLHDDEITLLQSYARDHGLPCMTRDAFVTDVFYKWVYRYEALCIAHNLPFDLGALATRCGDATGRYRGGFSLTLCACGHKQCFDHPPLRVKTLGRFKAMVQFSLISAPTKTGTRKRRPRRGKFLDTATLGRALLGPGDTSLAGLGRRFGVVSRKSDAPEHGATLATAYLDYARQDVAATWALYRAERALYKRHGVTKPMWFIYSEASLGKAYYVLLGVPPFMRQNKDFPSEVMGYAMVSYYGGRSDVRIRLQPVEVIYCDFKSQYPTVNALMGLQDLLIAERVDVRDCAADVRGWLATLTPADLQQPDVWRRLRCLVNIRPDGGDVLPVRAEYGPDGTNIGLNYLTSPPTWYTLVDVLASTLLTGKAPDVIEAVELVPVGRVETRPLTLFGDARYQIDLDRQDFFTEVINLRTEVKADMKRATSDDERDNLDGLQLALKLLANSTSYGVLVEVNADDDKARRQPITVYGMDTRATFTNKVERPGPYFAGAVGTLIPAAGRLLLALAERLATDRGIGYALCDTDSMTFARPDGMEREQFRALVQEVIEWFTPLSPYRDKPPIFEREDVNDWQGVPTPLYCIAVSAKRYALYNRVNDGDYRIRKFSSHGVGTWQGRDGYTSPPHVPAPCDSVRKLANGAGERWAYDLWYDAIAAIDGGTVYRDEPGVPRYYVNGSPWLNTPAFHRVTISTAEQYRTYRHVEGIRPFGFITVLPPLDRGQVMRRQMSARAAQIAAGAWPDEGGDGGDRYADLVGVPFYGPYARASTDLRDIHRADTHDTVEVKHKTLAECLERYYVHEEWKAAEPGGVGVLPRRKLATVQHVHIGKESDRVKLTAIEDSDGVIIEDEPQVYGACGFSDALRRFSVSDLMIASGVARQTIYDVLDGATPMRAIAAQLRGGLSLLDSEGGDGLAGWRDVPRACLAERMGLSDADMQKVRNGTRRVSEQERAVLIAAVTLWRHANDAATLAGM